MRRERLRNLAWGLAAAVGLGGVVVVPRLLQPIFCPCGVTCFLGWCWCESCLYVVK